MELFDQKIIILSSLGELETIINLAFIFFNFYIKLIQQMFDPFNFKLFFNFLLSPLLYLPERKKHFIRYLLLMLRCIKYQYYLFSLIINFLSVS